MPYSYTIGEKYVNSNYVANAWYLPFNACSIRRTDMWSKDYEMGFQFHPVSDKNLLSVGKLYRMNPSFHQWTSYFNSLEDALVVVITKQSDRVYMWNGSTKVSKSYSRG